MLQNRCKLHLRKGYANFSDVSFPFTADSKFLKVKSNPAASFGLVGIPYDGATTNRPGARFGPKAIREASHMLCDGIHPLFDTSPLRHLEDLGDLAVPQTSLTAFRAALEPAAREILASGRHMVWLGGDHSVTLSLLRAYRTHFKEPLSVIHFDAHCDTWESHMDEPSGHGTWAREAAEEGLVLVRGFAQLGLRSSGERSVRDFVADRGGLIFDARSLRGMSSASQLAPVVEQICARQVSLGSPPVYLTFDIDCLDPACAPGTGTPEPGGLSSAQALGLVEALAPRLRLVGMDCVEVAPAYDSAQLTSLAAAHIVWTYLSARLASQTSP